MAQLGCEVTGVDMNPVRVEQAKSLMNHPNLTFEVSDVTVPLPVNTARHDVVICSHVIEHLDDPIPMLAALRGQADRLMVAVPPSDSRWQKVMFRDLGLLWKDDEDHRREYSPELLREQLGAAGWRVLELHAGIDIKAVCVPNRAGNEKPISHVPAELDQNAYRELQAERSRRKASYDSMKRSGYLVDQLSAFLPTSPPPSVLCVGARDRCEIDCFLGRGYADVTAIDLHAGDPRIAVMDMHDMSFNAGSFDAVFASHSFEHAHDPSLVAREMRRVLKPDGLAAIEVPTGYTPTGVDLWDFVSPPNVAALFEPCELLWQETGPQLDAPHQAVFRMILRMRAS